MSLKKVINTILFLSVFFFSNSLFAQVNYTNVKVDQMTDGQIRQLMQSGASIGYDDSQLTQMAAAQGMSADEVQKLKARIDKIRSQDAMKSGGRIYSDSTDSSSPANTTAGRFNNSRDTFRNSEPKIFGEELFRNSKITFEPNLRMATPKNYIVGPDDELLIDISGNNEANYNLKVSPEGVIHIQYAGAIAVGGLTIEQAISKIKTVLAKTYPDLLTGRQRR